MQEGCAGRWVSRAELYPVKLEMAAGWLIRPAGCCVSCCHWGVQVRPTTHALHVLLCLDPDDRVLRYSHHELWREARVDRAFADASHFSEGKCVWFRSNLDVVQVCAEAPFFHEQVLKCAGSAYWVLLHNFNSGNTCKNCFIMYCTHTHTQIKKNTDHVIYVALGGWRAEKVMACWQLYLLLMDQYWLSLWNHNDYSLSCK